jgi:hypothetical protein
VQYGHTTLRLVEKAGKFRIATKTELPAELAERLGLRAVDDIAQVLGRWRLEEPHGVVGLVAGLPVYPRRPGP